MQCSVYEAIRDAPSLQHVHASFLDPLLRYSKWFPDSIPLGVMYQNQSLRSVHLFFSDQATVEEMEAHLRRERSINEDMVQCFLT